MSANEAISDLFSIQGRTALVTGGTAGIGRMIAAGFARAGARVYVCGRDEARGRQTAEDISREASGVCVAIGVDLAAPGDLNTLAKRLQEREDGLAILVNNAATEAVAPLDDFSEDDWDRVLNLNLRAPFFLTQKLLPLLRVAASVDRPATVINIGSVGGLRIGPKENYSYAASKSALHHITGSLAKRLGPEHVTVNAIAPGFFKTDLTKSIAEETVQRLAQSVPCRRIGRPSDVAGLAIFLASPAASYINGAVIPLAGGMTL
jgi:NAD(P)-dependent dehydrogenase (short-subunit alcohol dehydrogenase family)